MLELGCGLGLSSVAANVESLLRTLPRLVADGGEAWIADPDRRGGRDFLAAARNRFTLRSERFGGGAVHRLARAG